MKGSIFFGRTSSPAGSWRKISCTQKIFVNQGFHPALAPDPSRPASNGKYRSFSTNNYLRRNRKKLNPKSMSAIVERVEASTTSSRIPVRLFLLLLLLLYPLFFFCGSTFLFLTSFFKLFFELNLKSN